jgi:HlyD family secretion protein
MTTKFVRFFSRVQRRRDAMILTAAILSAVRLASSSAVAAESIDEAAQAVSVVEAKRMCLSDSLQVTGVLVPRRDVLVRPSKDGMQIKDVLVQPGDVVTSGQTLAHLRSADGSKDNTADVGINAPVAGIVYSISAIIGATASASDEPLFRIAQDGELELSAESPVNTMYRLAPDQSVTVEVVGVGEIAGKVRLASPAINQATQLGDVRLSVGSDRRLRVGAFGRGKIVLGQRCGPVVPLSAVLYGGEGAIVQVVCENRIETRQVTISLINGGDAEIQEGLAVGEAVVARSGAFVRDGDSVRSILNTNVGK